MFDAVLSGRLSGIPSVSATPQGGLCASWSMEVEDGHGLGLPCCCITFSRSVVDAVRGLNDGARITVTGDVRLMDWGDDKPGTLRPGFDVRVYDALTVRSLSRERKGGDITDNERGPL